ncbi:MAG: hypothetical protein GXO89_04820 [Chlorobi bacterium]|nr:hypothetical protein [Chlorobiota bacterium]
MGIKDFKENLLKHSGEFEKCYKEESKDQFFVVENEDNVSIIRDFALEDEPCLKIKNKNLQIGFLAFDKCYVEKIKQYSGLRCDCLLFSNNYLVFVELKLDVTSRRKTADNLKEGRKQLSNTISYFHRYFNVDFQSFSNNAIVVLPKQFYPRNQARLAILKKRFLIDNFGVEYFEDVEFTFNENKNNKS